MAILGKSYFSQMREQARTFFEDENIQPSVWSGDNVTVFFEEFSAAVKLCFQEKEIFVFAILQWVCIAVGLKVGSTLAEDFPIALTTIYENAIHQLDTRTERGFNEDAINEFLSQIKDLTFPIVMKFLGWSTLILILTGLPLSILNAAMVNAHFLRSAGYDSTFFRCLLLALRNVHRMWLFTALDAWFTMSMMSDRMPTKDSYNPLRKLRRVVTEILYYAWKVGTTGVMPALAADRNYKEAASESLELLKASPRRTMGIRLGYSLICWVIGILGYALVSVIFFGAALSDSSPYKELEEFEAQLYLMGLMFSVMFLPIVAIAGIVLVFIRPFYVIMIARLYTDHFHFSGKFSDALDEVSDGEKIYETHRGEEASFEEDEEERAESHDWLPFLLLLGGAGLLVYYFVDRFVGIDQISQKLQSFF